jgi:AraC family transcriptional activator FtrA
MHKITPKWSTTGPLVVALVYDGLCTFEFSIAAEIFSLARPEMGKNWYRFAACAIESGPLRAHGGLSFQAPLSPRLMAAADLIVIPGWKGIDAPVPDSLIRRLRGAHGRGARLASICSGAFVLAATGLLAGRRATTHWRYANAMQMAFPDVTVDADVLYIEDGRLLTSAGSAAGIDLMLHLVRTDFGAEAANSVARRLVAPPHRTGGQAQFIERPVPLVQRHELSALLDRVRAKLSEPWPLQRLAREVAMSERTFLRRFGDATGQTPNDWIIGLRIEEARRLLERVGTSIEEVAEHCGFGSLATLRHHFVRRVGVPPRDYRQRFARTTQGPSSRRA